MYKGGKLCLFFYLSMSICVEVGVKKFRKQGRREEEKQGWDDNERGNTKEEHTTALVGLMKLPVQLLYVYSFYMLKEKDSQVEGSSPPTTPAGESPLEKLVKNTSATVKGCSGNFTVKSEVESNY